ncbi:bifunctional pyr operon transcriptional regulator/uracil phosphoribosyltransferase PyrR [Aquisphaera insulae]|uniref:bifunctional pyr operon transcriptional regulator/uracil phosphoribosyltransferase PyrR n=1 Tax=Aquisphaera insulae TaxID=2712864 RepID=UPI0013EE3AA3|nr:bifunctional pyr operon transcriptional regulator/uracil phosphoribosyltransferase PyrR [Aquisphaera insulae]
MSDDRREVASADETAALIERMAAAVWAGRRPGSPFYLVGVRTRGAALAERLGQELSHIGGDTIAVGAVDITLYRDDLGEGRRWPVLRGTEIPFAVDEAEIILVDDVLFTGRTIRAAMNAICDLGRPGRIRLAVLVDRGHRELPIEPEVVGLKLATGRHDRVRVRLRPLDPADEIVHVGADPAHGPTSPERRPSP